MYESKELLKRVACITAGFYNTLIIVDEGKYLKYTEVLLDKQGDYKAVATDEFYVHPYFDGRTDFTISEGWYFDSYYSVKLQQRGDEDESVNNDQRSVS